MSELAASGLSRGDRKWIIVLGIILIVLGIIALANPLITVLATSVVFALVLITAGLASFFAGLTNKSASNRWIDMIFGVIAFVAGIMTFQAPLAGALTLVWILGVLYAVSGVLELAQAFGATERRGSLAILGIIDLLLGLWITFMLPSTALWTLAIIVGLGLAFRGIMLIYLSSKWRELSD